MLKDLYEGCLGDVGALREGERGTRCPLLAPRREQNLVITLLDTPLVPDLFIAQHGFDLSEVLHFPGLVCWICIAKCSIYRTTGPCHNHHLYTFQAEFLTGPNSHRVENR